MSEWNAHPETSPDAAAVLARNLAKAGQARVESRRQALHEAERRLSSLVQEVGTRLQEGQHPPETVVEAMFAMECAVQGLTLARAGDLIISEYDPMAPTEPLRSPPEDGAASHDERRQAAKKALRLTKMRL